MCGIIGYVGYQNTVPVLIKGLEKLEYRGYDSAGIACVDHQKGGLCVIKEKGKLGVLLPGMGAVTLTSLLVILSTAGFLTEPSANVVQMGSVGPGLAAAPTVPAPGMVNAWPPGAK